MRLVPLLLLVGAATHAARAGAQPVGGGGGSAGGSLTRAISYDYVFSHTGAGYAREYWVRAIILWRVQPDSGQFRPADTATQHASAREFRDRQRAAEDAGRTFLGGTDGRVVRSAELDADGRRLRVGGQVYDVPASDSALVVMVDRADGAGGPPVVAGVAYIDAHLPEGFWDRIWQRGDTTMLIPARHQDEVLMAALRASPVVRAFLR